MKRLAKRLAVLTTSVLLPCAAAHAAPYAVPFTGGGYDEARVVRSEPLYETVSYPVPRRVCRDERVERGGDYAVTRPVLGAVIGGAIGNAVGHHKENKRVGTVVGALLGAAIGHDISRRESDRDGGYEDVRQVCHEERDYRQERRVTGYNVTYRYAGETYTTQMRRDPGARLRVRVNVTPVDEDDGHDEYARVDDR